MNVFEDLQCFAASIVAGDACLRIGNLDGARRAFHTALECALSVEDRALTMAKIGMLEAADGHYAEAHAILMEIHAIPGLHRHGEGFEESA